MLMGRGYLRERYPPTALIYPDYLGSYHRFVDMGLVDNHCRIDNIQHALIALLNALRAMDNR
jgi:hypothetical protein